MIPAFLQHLFKKFVVNLNFKEALTILRMNMAAGQINRVTTQRKIQGLPQNSLQQLHENLSETNCDSTVLLCELSMCINYAST